MAQEKEGTNGPPQALRAPRHMECDAARTRAHNPKGGRAGQLCEHTSSAHRPSACDTLLAPKKGRRGTNAPRPIACIHFMPMIDAPKNSIGSHSDRHSARGRIARRHSRRAASAATAPHSRGTRSQGWNRQANLPCGRALITSILDYTAARSLAA